MRILSCLEVRDQTRVPQDPHVVQLSLHPRFHGALPGRDTPKDTPALFVCFIPLVTRPGELCRMPLRRSWLGRRFVARSNGYIRGIVLLGKEDTKRCIGTTPRPAPPRGHKHPQQTSKPYSCLRAPLTLRSS